MWLILTAVAAFGVKKAENLLVPYTSKIMTGAIGEDGFLLGFILMTMANVVITESQGSIGEFARIRMTRNVRHGIWNKLVSLPMKFFDKGDPQTLVSRITQDTDGSYAALASIVQLFAVLYGVYTNFMGMYRVYKELALIMLAGIPMVIITSIIVGKLQYKYEFITNNSISALTNFFAERLPNILHIKTCSMEDKELANGVKANEHRFKEEMRAKRRFIFAAPISSLAQYVNEIVLLILATLMVQSGTMQMYHLVNLYNYYLLFMGNAIMLTAVWQGIKTSHGACATISQIADEREEDIESGEDFPEKSSDIVFENVCFSYNEKKRVLGGVSFTVPEGKVTAIVGENGSGKSTIIKLLERFNEPDSGFIRFGGTELGKMKLREWRDKVGYLFQGDQIIKGSIRENLTYAIDRDITDEELIEAAKTARAYDFIMKKEDGFDTEISRFDSKLSGGEQQRLAIARIILKNPQYLIMDEATSGIDAVSENEVLEGISSMMKGRTVIMVSHDMNLIRKADHIIVLENGSVQADGSCADVEKNSALFRSFAATQC